jgi:D-3-phosphoglycerate dehydrogenase
MKIAYTGSHFPEKVKQGIQDYMTGKGYSPDMITLKTRDAWDSREALKEYDIIICAGEKYSEETIVYLSGSNKKLKMLSRHGIGTDEIRKDIAAKLGVAVCNAAGTLSACVAECALALTLNVLHGYNALDGDIRNGVWRGSFTSELRGKTVGLIGFGGIAQYFARYLVAFDCEILACDPYFNEIIANKSGVKKSTLEEIREKSDVISLHVPLTDETRGMINMDFMSKMKSNAIIVNTSRGAVINEKDLCEALETGIIAGAGLDVFEKEPVEASNPLLKMRNTMLLPHVASHSCESQLDAGIMACRNAAAFIEGREPESLLNPEYKNNI